MKKAGLNGIPVEGELKEFSRLDSMIFQIVDFIVNQNHRDLETWVGCLNDPEDYHKIIISPDKTRKNLLKLVENFFDKDMCERQKGRAADIWEEPDDMTGLSRDEIYALWDEEQKVRFHVNRIKEVLQKDIVKSSLGIPKILKELQSNG